MSKPTSATYYLPVQNTVADQFVQILRSNDFSALELRTHFFKYACESIGVVCFNNRLGCFEDPSTERGAATAKIIQNVIDVFYLTHRSTGKLPLYNFYPTKMYRMYEAAINGMYHEGLIYVKNALAELEKKKKDGTLDPNEPNFLLSLIKEKRLTIPQIVAITLDLFNGGTDSTAKNLGWNLYHLANNKDKQDRLYEEIKNILGTEREIKAEHINKMSYLQSCLKETFRLTFPTVCGTSRVLDHDIILSGYNIPKGTVILTNNRRAVLDEDVINQPFKYMPERWLRDKSGKRVNDIPTMAMLPFGFGVRNCPGRRFAEMEIYLAVTKIVQNLEVTLAPGIKHPDVEYHTFATPSHPIDLKFKPRH
ncbi:cytochrome P450 27C1 isoform X2 [Patella vulgata]|uniref:cytochrome P450 27C1 isoform X2 n=2 Tax=Patella vulgata TaxID=6465 RepID=UPI0021806557|nr:cytochrome P450 27C1 isoform X2 [Patella vulgata]